MISHAPRSRFTCFHKHSIRTVVATVAAFAVITTGAIYSADAASRPSMQLSLVGGDIVSTVGKHFPANTSVVVTTTYGDITNKRTTEVDTTGRFASSALAPVGYEGPVTVAVVDGTVKLSLTRQIEKAEPNDATDKVWKIMPLGDSITEVGNTQLGYRGTLYNKLTKAGVKVDMVGSVTATGPASLKDRDHEGHSGLTNEELAAQATAWVEAASPDIVIIHSGTNDIALGTSASETLARLKNEITAVYAGNPDAIVVVSQIIKSTPGRESVATAYNKGIPALVETFAASGKSITSVNLQDIISDDGMNPDGVHPNAIGQAEMGNALYPVVLELIRARTDAS